jgi:hypothetical protein
VQLVPLIALFGWIPFVVALFAVLPARRAMLASSIGAWLLLPSTGIDLPGLPAYDKAVAATAGIFLATLIFEPNRFASFRFRWFDLPVLVWCLCPFCSSLSNGLGVYDGVAAVVRQMAMWLLPYLVGRLYLTNLEGLRDLAVAMVIGGVCLVPLCLFEARMSPVLGQLVYGIGRFEGTRLGGYRPRVFFATGLELGLWMNAVTLVAVWLWWSGQLKALGRIPGGLVAAMLLITTLICRSTGATLLLVLGLGSLWVCSRTKTKWAMWAMLSIAPVYYTLRITDAWTGRSAVEAVRLVLGDDRAGSLEFRLINEDFFIAKTLQRPIFGWGGWGRNFVYGEDGRALTVIDQLTIIAFSANGYVGLVAMIATLLLPPLLFLRRFSVNQWIQADVAPAAAIALVLNLYLLDCMFNGMLNVIYLTAAGGLLNVVGVRPKPSRGGRDDGKPGQTASPGPHLPSGAASQELSTYTRAARVEPGEKRTSESECAGVGQSLQAAARLQSLTCEPQNPDLAPRLREPGEALALRYQTLGRDSKMRGRFAEAKLTWMQALEQWNNLITADPDHPLFHQNWCDCANDLAWLLANAPDPAVRDPASAVELASQTAQTNPSCATYWNTLGAAHYRAGDFHATIAALSRAVDLTEGGTAFDHVFLAMAHAQLGDQEQARHWLDLAKLWAEQHSPDHAELTSLRAEAKSVLR